VRLVVPWYHISMAIDEYDERTIRCPRIGDFVPFKYCRKAGNPFCWTLIHCWAAKIDIGQYLADNYEPEIIQQGLKRPEKGRVGKMLELSDQYRKP